MMFKQRIIETPLLFGEAPRDWRGGLRALVRELSGADYTGLLVKVTGDNTAALMLAHLLDWWPSSKRKDGAVWRSDSQWREMVGVRISARRKAALERAGVMIWVEQAMGSPTLHFKLDAAKFCMRVAEALACGIKIVRKFLLIAKKVLNRPNPQENGGQPSSNRDSHSDDASNHSSNRSSHSFKTDESITESKTEKEKTESKTDEAERPLLSGWFVGGDVAPDGFSINEKALDECVSEKMSVRDAWKAAYNQLELQLDRSTFDTWLRQAKLLDYADGKVTVWVHNNYARDMLQYRLYRNVWRVLSDVSGLDVAIEFVAPESKSVGFRLNTTNK